MIDYINRLMEKMPDGLLRKLFIVATVFAGQGGNDHE